MSRRVLHLAGLTGMALVFTAMSAYAAGERRSCGDRAGTKCDRGLWCEPRPGNCQVRRAAGTCVKVHQVCTMIYQPVCGCDGKTYSNDCVRRSQRVAKRRDGEC